MYIKKGDNIIVISGKDRGKAGKVTRALPREDKVIVEGINMKTKHQRAKKANQKGQTIDRAMPIHVSNVMIVDPKTGKQTRIGYSSSAEGIGKVRIARKSGQVLDK